MSFLFHLRIGARLGAGFAVLLVLRVASTALGLRAMSILDANMTSIVENDDADIAAATTMGESFREIMNLTSLSVEATSTDETGQLLQALKAMNESLVKIVGEVRQGTDAIGTASSQIASVKLEQRQGDMAFATAASSRAPMLSHLSGRAAPAAA